MRQWTVYVSSCWAHLCLSVESWALSWTMLFQVCTVYCENLHCISINCTSVTFLTTGKLKMWIRNSYKLLMKIVTAVSIIFCMQNRPFSQTCSSCSEGDQTALHFLHVLPQWPCAGIFFRAYVMETQDLCKMCWSSLVRFARASSGSDNMVTMGLHIGPDGSLSDGWFLTLLGHLLTNSTHAVHTIGKT